jgi:hypothetical protein
VSSRGGNLQFRRGEIAFLSLRSGQAVAPSLRNDYSATALQACQSWFDKPKKL